MNGWMDGEIVNKQRIKNHGNETLEKMSNIKLLKTATK